MKKVLLVAAVVAMVCIGSVAQAAIHTFNQSQLVSMNFDPVANIGFTPLTAAGLIVAAPNYTDNIGMTGVAGATGEIDPNLVNAGIAYTLEGAGLAAFNASTTGGDTLALGVYNDNNQLWEIGIWVWETGAVGPITAGATVNPFGGSATVSLVLPAGDLVRAGVYVRSTITQPDRFHASFSPVPEATTILVWSVLGTMGLTFSGRRRNRG